MPRENMVITLCFTWCNTFIVHCQEHGQAGPNTMVSGVMQQYHQAAVPPLVLLYVDCGSSVCEEMSRLPIRFAEW